MADTAKKQVQLKATLIDENGNVLEYEPYAFMVYEGENFLIMHTNDDLNAQDEIIVLKAENDASKEEPVFSFVERDTKMNQAIQEGLGFSKEMLH